ncbi:MAG: acetyl-CoA carboxylase biotin carboxylase subunit, partial [Alphaproteobacteria bacterium]
GKNRTECLMRLRRSLAEFVIAGIETTIPRVQARVNEKDIIDGDYSIHWLEKYLKRQQESG